MHSKGSGQRFRVHNQSSNQRFIAKVYSKGSIQMDHIKGSQIEGKHSKGLLIKGLDKQEFMRNL